MASAQTIELKAALVEQLDVISIARAEEHKDEIAVSNEGFPDVSGLPQMAIAYLVLVARYLSMRFRV